MDLTECGPALVERQAQIQYIKGEMSRTELQAHYWLTVANTGHYKTRDVADGADVPYTEEKKLATVLETAQRHIHRHGELNDTLNDLLRGKQTPLSYQHT